MTGITRPGAKRPRSKRPWEPYGPEWDARRGRILATATRCYHCQCPASIAPCDQVEHLIPAETLWHAGRKWLMHAEENLRPTHSRCPSCGLACNNLSAAVTAPRDPVTGKSLPFDEAFKARKMAEAAAKAAGLAPARGVAKSRPARRPAPARPAAAASEGRPW